MILLPAYRWHPTLLVWQLLHNGTWVESIVFRGMNERGGLAHIEREGMRVTVHAFSATEGA